MNELLQPDARIPFEFLIQGYPLRSSLEEWLSAHGASAEDVLQLEYIRAQLPPTYVGSFKHDDWIGAVDVASAESHQNVQPGHERILSGSFDGCVRVWNMSGQCLATSDGSAPPDEYGKKRLPDGRLPQLLAARFVSHTSVVASGWRAYLRMWNYEESESAVGGESANLVPSMDLYGHKLAVNSLAVDRGSERVLSGSDDHTAMLWTTSATDAPAAEPSLISEQSSSRKRRKLNPVTTLTRGQLTTLSGHKSSVKGAVFHPSDSSVAYTCSMDGTMKTWDLETSTPVQSKLPGGPHTQHRSIYAMRTLGLVATGSADRKIFLVDPREDAVRQSVGTLTGHQNAVTCLDGDPGSEYGLCSGSFDGCVRIWDIRVAQDPASERRGSTYKIPRHGKGARCDRIEGGEGVKIFGVKWDPRVGVVSVGENKMVQIDRVSRSN